MDTSRKGPSQPRSGARRWLGLSLPTALSLSLVGLGCIWAGGQLAADALGGARPAQTGSSPKEGAQSRSALAGYTLSKPDLMLDLPESLREVSGLTDVSPTQVACVQDEQGIIFVYDLEERQVTQRVRFGPPGDYEGLTRVDNSYFVLRSDGTLYEVESLQEEPIVRSRVLTGLPKDNEGLAWDFRRQQLLIAPKSSWGKGKRYRDLRPIFAVDPRGQRAIEDAVLSIHVSKVEEFAESHDIPLPRTGKRDAVRLRPSSVAVHPVTRETFVVSALDGVLAAFNEQGQVSGYALLDTDRLPQPEGITFLPRGDLVITSEAASRKPTLAVFRWRGAPAASKTVAPQPTAHSQTK